MYDGNWVPMRKTLVDKLPQGRAYSEVEAMFALTVDYDNDSHTVSVSGYAKQWGWSRKRVVAMLDDCGLEIIYESKFSCAKNGSIAVKNRDRSGIRSGAGQGQVRFVDSKASRGPWDRSGTGGVAGRVAHLSSLYPDPDPKDKNISPDSAPDIDNQPVPAPAPKKASKEKPCKPGPDYLAEIADLMQRYDSHAGLFPELWPLLAMTTKSGKITDAARRNELRYYAGFETEIVLTAISKYINGSYHLKGYGSAYLRGIIRGTDTEAKVKDRLQAKAPQQPQPPQQYGLSVIEGGQAQTVTPHQEVINPASLANGGKPAITEQWRDGYIDRETWAVRSGKYWIYADGSRGGDNHHEQVRQMLRAGIEIFSRGTKAL